MVKRQVRSPAAGQTKARSGRTRDKSSGEAEGLILSVRMIDGVYCVETEPGRPVPIRTEGGTLCGHPGTVLDGWHPQFVYAGLAPVHALEWQHQNGNTGTWYLDAEMRGIGGSHKEPPPDAMAIIGQKGGELLGELWDGLLCAPDPAIGARYRAFLRLNAKTNAQILDAALGSSLPELAIANLGTERDDDRAVPVSNGSRLVECRSRLLLQCLETERSIIDKAVTGIPSGALTWPSPVDGRPLSTDTVLCLDDFRFAYRLVDIDHQIVFYVICSGYECRAMALLFPAARQLFCSKEREVGLYLPGLANLVTRHLSAYVELIPDYLCAPKRAFLWYLHGFHHGHWLFNDLSGVDELVHTLRASDLPEIAMQLPPPSEGNVEVYGKVEELFPELAGKIERSVFNRDALIRRNYTERRCVLRATRESVSRRLADRVVEVNLQGPGLEPERERLEAIRAKGWPIVLVDLRIENRTLVDLPGFCTHLIEFLIGETGGVAVVLAGHSGAYVGDVDRKAQKPPAAAQKEIVAELIRNFAGRQVELIDTVGTGMRRTVFWSHHAHFFVAPWGASLATYRWVCNKPGLIMASRYNLHHGSGQGDIYSSQEVREDPTPVTYLAEEFVKDDAESPRLSSWMHGGQAPESFYNFRVDERAVFAEVSRLLHEFGPPAARSPRVVWVRRGVGA